MNMFQKYLNHTGLDYKQYQYDGVEWCIKNELSGCGGGFVADEMGLGKTIMMIGTMLSNFVKKTLIVLPPILIEQWYQQIYKTTGHKPLVFYGKNKKIITLQHLQKSIIVLTSYHTVSIFKHKSKEESLLHSVTWNRIIFDEAHHLRNKNYCYHGAKLLKSNIRWLVSGTPIQNKKKDFYNLCSLLHLPTSFYMDPKNLPILTKTYILKRTKNQVGIILPDVSLKNTNISWKNIQEMQLSQEIHSSLAFSNILSKSNIIQSLNKHMFSLILMAKQSCILPRILKQKFEKLDSLDNFSNLNKEAFQNSSKLDHIIENIILNKDNGNGKLIFCHFREEINEISKRLLNAGLQNVHIFDGRTTLKQRKLILQNKNKNDVLILQIATGCEGLNLQENYSEIYFISPNWNPFIEDQAIARCHRIGQLKTVSVYRYEMKQFNKEDCKEDSVNIDSYMLAIQERKRNIVDEIIGSNKNQ